MCYTIYVNKFWGLIIMSSNWYSDIQDLVRIYEQEYSCFPCLPSSSKTVDLRISLIDEEINKELIPAMRNGDLVGIADGCIDSIVVILGALVAYGIDPGPIWDEIHRTNVEKARGPLRIDGKRLKPEGWTPPKVYELLLDQNMKEETNE